MGSHAGCTGGALHSDTVTALFSLAGMPRLQRALPLSIPLRPTFAVGINQIDLDPNGSEDYHFLPEIKRIEHPFVNFTAATEPNRFYSAHARLNPDGGISTTTFEAVDPTQKPFFPCTWRMSLYLELRVHIPLFKPLGREEITLFNKEPLLYQSAVPLSGFPPLNGPDLILQRSVDLFDFHAPQGPPVTTIQRGAIIRPANRVLYDIDVQSPVMDDKGHFRVSATLSLTQPVAPVRTEIALLSSRGVTIDTPRIHDVTFDNTPHKLEITGHIDDRDQPHHEVTIRPFSTDPAHIGFGHRAVSLPGPHSEGRLRVEEPPVRRIKTGQAVDIQAAPRFDLQGEDPEYIWVAPHGVYLENSSSPNPRFIAPAVSELTDIWFTLYIRHRGEMSRPFEYVFQVSPR